MIFEYIDNSQKGTLKAGMSRDDVQKIFNTKIYEFKKTPFCEITSDAFYEIEIPKCINPFLKLEIIDSFEKIS